MNHNNGLTSVYQQSKVQSEGLRSFTLIDLYADEVVLLAESPKALLSALVAQEMLSGIVGLEILAAKLWSGQVCIINACEMVIVPNVQLVSRINLNYLYPETTSSVLFVVGEQ